jgi:hypothetical protein
VCNRVEAILAAYLGKWNKVVNMNKASATLAIKRREIEGADGATDSVMLDALLACAWATLIDADRYLSRGSLEIGFGCRNLIGKG